MDSIFTSNFKRSGKDRNAISIARSEPKWYNGQTIKMFAPHSYMLHLDSEKEYRELYDKILARIEQRGHIDNLINSMLGKILLCWETPGEFCHRRIVAKWIEKQSGIVVSEVGYEGQPPLFKQEEMF